MATCIEMPVPVSSAISDSGEHRTLLELRGVVKTFGSFRALDSVDFDLREGEVHILFGENGAGKSTLINIISGALSPDAGTLSLKGKTANFRSVQQARKEGIATVFQEFSLAPALTVEDNLLLGSEPTRWGFLNKAVQRSAAQQALDRLGFNLKISRKISDLSRAEQQMVEIAKAMLTKPAVLILDEPTASLTDNEVEQLFSLVRQLKASGVGIIYITHRMQELSVIGDRVTVLRDGRKVETLDVAEAKHDRLVELMTGRQIGQFFPQRRKAVRKAVVFEATHLVSRDGLLKGASFHLRAGEIVGLAGLVGCGKSEIGRSCVGLHALASGEQRLLGEKLFRPTPEKMLARGLGYLPSDRRAEGLFMQLSVRENIAAQILPYQGLTRCGFLRSGREKSLTNELAGRVKLRPLSMERKVGEYSGGNQQKIVFSRGLTRPFRMLILDEPTVGVDVQSKLDIYNLLYELVAEGMAILLISSDMAEITNICDRVYVVRNGEINLHLENTITETQVLSGFF
jgi:ribose transport system ATP-binding protein